MNSVSFLVLGEQTAAAAAHLPAHTLSICFVSVVNTVHA